MTTDGEEGDGMLSALRRDLLRIALRDRWDRLFAAFAWLHLAGSALAQFLYDQSWHQSWIYVSLWCVETAIVLVLLRVLAGPRWFTQTPLAGVLLRVWATFFLVAFGAATLNARTGFAVDWFKLSWSSLSSFGWATTAALLGWRFLIPAFQMYFTGLLISRFPQQGYLIFGASWFLALQGLGLVLALRRRNESRAALSAPSARREARAVHHLRA